MYSARILLDSVNEAGERLTTMEITYPRFVHGEFMAHRLLSRNAASSRAIPVEKMIERVQNDPVLPVWWGKNQPGMQAREELGDDLIELAKSYWLMDRDAAVKFAQLLIHDTHLHKQIVNRLLEPWMWITVIVTATDWANFFTLRCHPDAQPELRQIAEMMREAYTAGTPQVLQDGEWHLPLVTGYDEGHLRGEDNCPEMDLVKISAGRAARISYLQHDGKRSPDKDIELHDRLLRDKHMSPFEHAAYANPGVQSGNFTGWTQYRKMVEHGFHL